ncbi:MAG: tRNA methyltransferase [Deltaproteobacteria bacterium]|nr:tRNA methyltransferase [Deltaproteobacteria bacterium]
MRPKFPTDERKARIREVLSRRQPDLTLVLNNIHDPHNVSAILRSCDAFGVFGVHLLYTSEVFPTLGHKSSASARKWIQTECHADPASLAGRLHRDGFSVLATGFSPRSAPLNEINFTRPTAVILGNEHRGVDPEFAPLVDGEIFIPMQGMVQSLNVSVAAALILYEAWRQRSAAGFFDRPRFDAQDMETLFEEWCQI